MKSCFPAYFEAMRYNTEYMLCDDILKKGVFYFGVCIYCHMFYDLTICYDIELFWNFQFLFSFLQNSMMLVYHIMK